MSKKAQVKTVRRSFALSSKLIDEALMVDTEAKSINLNKLVTIALQEYVNNKKRREFEKLMQAMEAIRIFYVNVLPSTKSLLKQKWMGFLEISD